MARTASQVAKDIIDLIAENFAPSVPDTRIGTVLSDAYVTPESVQISNLETGVDSVSSNQSIRAPESVPSDVMDGLAANFGLSRFSGSPAVGVARFYKVVSPLSTITIPAGTRIATGQTNISDSRIFVVLGSVTLTPTSPADPITGAAAYVDVAVESSVNGEQGNVDSGTINTMIDFVAGIDGVYNPSALTGGKSIQSNTELAALITNRSQGRLGTKSGYVAEVLQNFAVDDVVVVGPNDIDAVRNQFGGAVDVVILNKDTVSASEVFAYSGPSVTQLIPTLRPLVSVVSISGTDSFAAPITLQGPPSGVGVGVDYDVSIDTTGPSAGSVQESSRIVLHPTVNIPGNGTTLTVTYKNNQLVRIIQSFFDNENNKVMGTDLLVKAGVRIGTEITAYVRVIPGFSTSAVTANVATAVTNHFAALKLGVSVEESDIITVIGNVAGVSFVDIPTFVMAKTSAPAVPLQVVTARQEQFVGLDAVTVNLI